MIHYNQWYYFNSWGENWHLMMREIQNQRTNELDRKKMR